MNVMKRAIALVLCFFFVVPSVNHAQGQHGFDIENDDDRSREIIRRMIDFIKTHN